MSTLLRCRPGGLLPEREWTLAVLVSKKPDVAVGLGRGFLGALKIAYCGVFSIRKSIGDQSWLRERRLILQTLSRSCR